MDMAPSQEKNIFLIFLVEFIFSWIFLTIYLHAKCDWVAPSQDFGLRAFTMMGITYACTAMSQPLNGGALNPSIAIAATTFRLFIRKSTDPLNIKYIFPYLLGPLLAGILAGLFLKFFAIKNTP